MKQNQIESDYGAKIETIFKAVEPFDPIKNGFGYLGILLRDTIADKIQCHICGVWRKSIGNHVSAFHKIKSKEYRKRFSLPLMYPLCAKSLSKLRSEISSKEDYLKRLAKVRNVKKMLTAKGRRKYTKYGRTCMASLNKSGACPEQIMRRYWIVADQAGKEPNQRDLIKFDHSLWAIIRRRYKNLNEFRKAKSLKTIKKSPLFKNDEIIAALRKFSKEYNRVPSSNDFRKTKNGYPNVATIRNHFGSFHKAMLIAGFGAKHYQTNKSSFMEFSGM